MSDKLKIGDIIQLKSGGPKMTVTKVFNDSVQAAWFAGSKKEVSAFPFEAVMTNQEEKKS